MKKFKYGKPGGDKWDNMLTEEYVLAAKASQAPELVALMERKALTLCDSLNFQSYSERLLFLDAFYKGYIAAHCFNEEEEALRLALSPLGKALT